MGVDHIDPTFATRSQEEWLVDLEKQEADAKIPPQDSFPPLTEEGRRERLVASQYAMTGTIRGLRSLDQRREEFFPTMPKRDSSTSDEIIRRFEADNAKIRETKEEINRNLEKTLQSTNPAHLAKDKDLNNCKFYVAHYQDLALSGEKMSRSSFVNKILKEKKLKFSWWKPSTWKNFNNPLRKVFDQYAKAVFDVFAKDTEGDYFRDEIIITSSIPKK